MRLPIPLRILASAVLSVAVMGLLIALGGQLTRPAIQAATLSSLITDADFERCVATPQGWGAAGDGFSLFAYDRHGVSANPAAPALEVDLRDQALRTGELARRESESRVISLLPSGRPGPCALFRVQSGNVAVALRTRLLTVLGLTTLGGMLLAAVGAFVFVLQPLRRRITAVSVSAQGVGTEGFSLPPVGDGALGTIVEVLAESHRRVLETREALEDRNRALQDHLAGIAHDLRTPLSSMQLAMEAVVASSGGALQPEARRALADVVYLSSLVENLHQAARLQHELDVKSGTVELVSLVRRMERRFVIVGRNASVSVAASVPDGEVRIACTPALAERAISNLIQNAIEHHPGEGNVAVTLSAADSRFNLVVADDGPGLPEGALASLEQTTFMADAARPRGPGLGMLITAEVARRAGWTLRYGTREPCGLEVRIEGQAEVRSSPTPVH